MMYEEFAEIIQTKAPTQEQYEVIEKVYTNHPAFEVDLPKVKAARLYDLMGYGDFKDMEPIAEEAEKLAIKMRELTSQLNKVKEEYKELSEKYKIKLK